MEKPITSRSDPESRKAYSRWHYRQNKPVYKARARIHTDQSRDKVREWLFGYLSERPCKDCGEPDPIVLEFDHRPGETKAFNIADAVGKGYSVESVEIEVSKCDVRCANCHRRITYKRAGRNHRHDAG